MQSSYVSSMTEISSRAFEAATIPNMTAQEAADLLMHAVQIRTFADILRSHAQGMEPKQALVKGLCANDPQRNRASVEKKVRDWLSGRYQPTAREDLLELCFIMELSLDEADEFLAEAGESGLHWRDPRELVYAFALRRRMNYLEAQDLLRRVLPQEIDLEGSGESESFTPLIHKEADAIQTEEELRQYLTQAADRLGTLHNSAYRQFLELMSVLEKPQSYVGEEKRYTSREIVEQYLDKHLPSKRGGKAMSEKLKSILVGWPDEVTISRMKNRKADVSRKILILLFLATDGGEPEEESWEECDAYEEEIEEEDEAELDFRSSYMRMNQMLAGCGYRMLDPRNPFDWIALYCMRVQEDRESMDGLNERLAHVLDVLFTAAPSGDQ
ncbi:MAG TPA: hypothetical protein IAB02_07045 [Candidatus Pullichristensenella excrementigallinarum]|uniref:Uncharacterized protein n=1 Tax=Candidatus Pullichristensenella excrementigallinarum TaxID=2840907 RepID=A0A9D1LD31_9FIRM|nr:hypothetical protein [Candidatus Pullichristensenella excrementigallinarum]